MPVQINCVFLNYGFPDGLKYNIGPPRTFTKAKKYDRTIRRISEGHHDIIIWKSIEFDKVHVTLYEILRFYGPDPKLFFEFSGLGMVINPLKQILGRLSISMTISSTF